MQSILLSGGTGTFGRAFARHVLVNGFTDRLCVFSRGEHAQADLRAELGNDERLRFFIGDVRDRDRLRRAMEGCALVVHAAALKRIEVCEYCPAEVVKTNVDGAVNVIEAATDAGVSRVVALSTDKADSPRNAYGASKLLAEKLFLAANAGRGASGPLFAVTRYGNIAGSAGSVIPKWRAMIAAGAKTVPVTDPDATRYWMKIEEAVDLVLQTAASMRGGELAIPDWLPAYRLGDLAEAMGVKMQVIGLPPFEKRHESMREGLTSDTAPRLSVDELREKLNVL
jgi:UDP-N-acetylglucosamine 4,6-dehydratase